MGRQLMRSAFAAVVTFVAVAVAGCTTKAPDQPKPEPPPAGWPAQLDDFTITWSAEPGIELTTGAAVVVRAYEESYYLATITDDDKYLYPGFVKAVEANQPGKRDGTEDLRPESSTSETWVGTARHQILSVTRSDRDVTVLVCAYLYGSAAKQQFDYAANVGSDFNLNSGIYPLRIGLRAPEDANTELPAQEGPSRAPSDNVFGGWKVTSHQGGYMTTSRWDDYDRDQATCIEKAGGTPESRHFLPGGGYSRSDFPTLPATPGWPEKPAS
ncbi:MAG: hypothetical protein QOC69_440 [Mycobacterium sp.]|nr:hypothetical protein [Mycobacterium sp.]